MSVYSDFGWKMVCHPQQNASQLLSLTSLACFMEHDRQSCMYGVMQTMSTVRNTCSGSKQSGIQSVDILTSKMSISSPRAPNISAPLNNLICDLHPTHLCYQRNGMPTYLPRYWGLDILLLSVQRAGDQPPRHIYSARALYDPHSTGKATFFLHRRAFHRQKISFLFGQWCASDFALCSFTLEASDTGKEGAFDYFQISRNYEVDSWTPYMH